MLGIDAEFCRRVQEDVRRRFPMRDEIGGIGVRREDVPQPGLAQFEFEERDSGGAGDCLRQLECFHRRAGAVHLHQPRLHRRAPLRARLVKKIRRQTDAVQRAPVRVERIAERGVVHAEEPAPERWQVVGEAERGEQRLLDLQRQDFAVDEYAVAIEDDRRRRKWTHARA